MNLKFTLMFTSFLFCVLFIPLTTARIDISPTQTIQLNSNDNNILCPANTTVLGIANNNNKWAVQYLGCYQVTNVDSTKSSINFSNPYVIDGSGYQENFFCNDGDVVCGIAKGFNNYGAEAAIDQVYCCKTNGFKVNNQNAEPLFGETKGWSSTCAKKFPSKPFVCGMSNSNHAEWTDAALCCGYYLENDFSCYDGLDNDNDDLSDCADPDCDGSIGPNGVLCSYGSEFKCNDGLDNDADTFIDMEDKDCFITESSKASPKWDNNGPIPNISFDGKLGILASTSDFKSWWKPFAKNGTDGVCGDDSLLGGCKSSSNMCASRSYNRLVCESLHCKYSLLNYSNNYTAVGGGSDCDYLTPLDCGSGYESAYTFYAGTTDCCYYDDYGIPVRCGTQSFENRLCVKNESVCYETPETVSFCNSFSDLTSCTINGCEWDGLYDQFSFGRDYASVVLDNSQLCYNYNASLKSPRNTWEWLGASENGIPYKFYTVKNPEKNKTTDYVSNGKEWFYCNANPEITSGLGGTPVNEGSSFTTANTGGGYFCSEFLTLIFSPRYVFTDSTSCDGVEACCYYDGAPVSFTGDVESCLSSCFINGEEIDTSSLCEKYPQYFPTYCGSSNSGFGDSDFVLKSLCSFDLAGCLNLSDYSGSKSCSALKGSICNSQQVCSGGVFVKSSDSNSCCYGPRPSCVDDLISVLNDSECVSKGGFVISEDSQTCIGKSVSIGSLDDFSCCFGIPQTKDFGNSLLSLLSPNTSLCFKKSNDNYFGVCVFDNSTPNTYINSLISSGDIVGFSKNRVFTQGTSIHTLHSFDKFKNGTVQDNVRRKTFTQTNPVFEINTLNSFEITNYSYLEFDIAYNLISPNLNLFIKRNDSTIYNYYVDDFIKFSTNGDSTNRWHHIVIPLNHSNISENRKYSKYTLEKISFSKSDLLLLDQQIVVDSFILTPAGNDLNVNTKNYYCTGGFGTWIEDLDPPNTTNFTKWDSYGPYKFACEAQAAFGWTGSQCCGDDTKLNNYGEFFEDSKSACFNGSVVLNGWTVAESKNNDEYADLLFSNGKFYGCQVPKGKYSDLNISYNGTNKLSINLFNESNNIIGQCAIIAGHYCSNQKWNKLPVNVSQVEIKTAPPGLNLINNGKFGGGNDLDIER